MIIMEPPLQLVKISARFYFNVTVIFASFIVTFSGKNAPQNG